MELPRNRLKTNFNNKVQVTIPKIPFSLIFADDTETPKFYYIAVVTGEVKEVVFTKSMRSEIMNALWKEPIIRGLTDFRAAVLFEASQWFIPDGSGLSLYITKAKFLEVANFVKPIYTAPFDLIENAVAPLCLALTPSPSGLQPNCHCVHLRNLTYLLPLGFISKHFAPIARKY